MAARTLLLVLFFFVMTPAHSDQTSEIPPGKKMPDVEFELTRAQIIKEALFSKIDAALEKHGNQEMAKVFRFLEKDTILAIPTEEGTLPLEKMPGQAFISLVFISEKDSQISQEWEDMIMADRTVEFYSDIRAIVVRIDKMADLNPFEVTLYLLHKGYESKIFLANGGVETGSEKQQIKSFVTEAICSLQ
ncbi:MAG TPA: hypothetical protein DIC35_00140 [Candidatus Moranbacteria bacterium]|nr:hypothetical protein [Candidatus Moranbacteria bacterium]